MKKNILITVVVICIVAIAIGWYVFQPKEEEKLFVGAYLEYEVEGMMYGKTLSGTVKLEVVEIIEETYTVHIKYDLTLGGEPYFTKPKTETFRFNEPPISEEDKEGTEYIGDKTIRTAIGIKMVAHYLNEEGGVKTDTYVDKVSNLVLAEYEESSEGRVNIEVFETNIEWLKG